MSIFVDSPRQTVHLHLPFLSLTTKLLWSCPTTASLGFTVTIIWEKKKKKKPLQKASTTYYLKQQMKRVLKKKEKKPACAVK